MSAEEKQLMEKLRAALGEYVGYLRDIEEVAPSEIRIEIEEYVEEALMEAN
jgi:hypothetical protein